MTGLRVIRARLGAEAGVTLTEMLVVLVILLIVLAGMTTLFTSASNSQVDQTNRVEAQRNARLALDSLRREIRCASAVTAVSTSSLTITLPGYCQKPPTTTAAPITWCVPGGSAPYALWRYAGSSCAGTGVKRAESLVANTVFSYNRAAVLPAPTLTGSATGGTLEPGTYVYDVTAVDASLRARRARGRPRASRSRLAARTPSPSAGARSPERSPTRCTAVTTARPPSRGCASWPRPRRRRSSTRAHRSRP